MTDAPLASCLMPTANRRAFIPTAIALFLAQDYPCAELVILDDGDDAVGDLVPRHESIRYIRVPPGPSLGAKRNAACALARGEILLHWDDDDWYAPGRIRLQVEALLAGKADICGIFRVLFADHGRRAAWEYAYPIQAPPWVCGAALAFRSEFWRANPFPDLDIGEDTAFVAKVRPGKLFRLSDNRFFVARIHANNTTTKPVDHPYWRPCDFDDIVALTGPGWGAPS